MSGWFGFMLMIMEVWIFGFFFCFCFKVPVGRATLGRIMNVLGEPIDERGEISEKFNSLLIDGSLSADMLWECVFVVLSETEHYLPIHRDAPALVDLATGQEILATGIKVHSGLLFYPGPTGYMCFHFSWELTFVTFIPGCWFTCSVPKRRKDWALWRCWCWQNCAHYGTD